jgi:uncharacterized membrane protein
MILLYIAAGINHFLHPGMYVSIVPPWIPFKHVWVDTTGVAEVWFAILMIFRLTRRIGAWAIIALLIAVFPANIQMMLNYLHEHNPWLWLAILRLPLQAVLIWWAYTFAMEGRHLFRHPRNHDPGPGPRDPGANPR